MKKIKSIIFILFPVLFYASINASHAQDKIVELLDKELVKIDSNEAQGFFIPLSSLERVLQNNKIIAFGEATHGTREFNDFRMSLIKKLVLHFNYKVIITESDFYSTKDVNDYIVFGKGSAKQCLQSMGYWMWNNPDFLKTIEWLKEYNAKQDFVNKVHFYGCDMTVPGLVYSREFLNLKLSSNALKAVENLKAWGGKSLSSDDNQNFEILRLELMKHQELYPDTSIFKRAVTTIIQSIDFRKAKVGFGKSQIRDKSMATNINWIYNNEFEKKLIFLAHAAHISKEPLLDGSEKVGGYLKKDFGNSYYALGSSFYKGDFRAMDYKTNKSTVFTIPELQNKDAYEFILKQCKTPNLFFDFNNVKTNPELTKFFNSKKFLRLIGANYSKTVEEGEKTTMLPLAKLFDGIVFFRTTNAILPAFPWQKY